MVEVETKRLFIAIPLPEFVLDVLERTCRENRIRNIRWIPKDNWHMTIYFLGNVVQDKIEILSKDIDGMLKEMSQFSLTFDQIIFAPPNRPPRMIWATFLKNDAYQKLVESVSRAVKNYAEEKETRKEPIPHVTLARFKDPNVARGINFNQSDLKGKQIEVSKIQLIESTLTSQGSAYAVLKSFKLF